MFNGTTSLCFPFNVQRYHGTFSESPSWNGRCFGVACLILDFVLNSIYLNVYNLDLHFGASLVRLSYCHHYTIAVTLGFRYVRGLDSQTLTTNKRQLSRSIKRIGYMYDQVIFSHQGSRLLCPGFASAILRACKCPLSATCLRVPNQCTLYLCLTCFQTTCTWRMYKVIAPGVHIALT